MHIRSLEPLVRARDWQVLLGLTVLALALRLGYRLAQGEEAFLIHGYTFYRAIAETFLDGNGFCFSAGLDCAVRVPLYPLIVSVFLNFDWLYPGLPIVQAAMSASRCLLAFGIGSTLFNRRAGVIAGALAAIHPYSVVHSTTLQDTSLFNWLVVSSVYLLLESRRPQRGAGFSLAAGLVLGLAMLTTVRLVVFIPLAVLWAALPGGQSTGIRLRQAVLVSVPILLLMGGWVARNWFVVGAPVLTTEAGLSLWVANNPTTFDFYPARSVDRISQAAYERLPVERQTMLASIGNEVDADRLMGRWGMEYMRTHPGKTLLNMGRKAAWAFSGQLSPAQEGIVQLAYAAYSVPLHVLAFVGLWRSCGKPGGHLLVYLLFGAFVITTAVFWAHTSHKSTLHLFLGVYAASVIAERWPVIRREPAPADVATQSPAS